MRPSAFSLLAIVLLAGGCERLAGGPPTPAPGPSAELTRRAVLALLPGLQFGPDPAQHTVREIRAVEVAGSHFVPATDRWTVHYCIDYVSFASDAPLRRCDLSVDVYVLDSQKWVGYARGAGTLYRWQVLDGSATQGDAVAQPSGARAPEARRESE